MILKIKWQLIILQIFLINNIKYKFYNKILNFIKKILKILLIILIVYKEYIFLLLKNLELSLSIRYKIIILVKKLI